MWRKLRILALLLVLLFIAANQYLDRVYSTDWDTPLRVTAYPINADDSAVTKSFIQQQQPDAFAEIEAFFQEQAQQYGIKLERPIRFTLAPQLHETPPALAPGSGRLPVMLWSLRARYWAWRVPEPKGPAPDIKLFVLYHDPARSQSLPHSLGLQKGLFGIVHAFADRNMVGSNATVIAHELLHTLGATDKYDFATNQPVYPLGYAEPERQPRYPQEFAELMAGRVPLSADESETPQSLRQVIVGAATALEIGWRRR